MNTPYAAAVYQLVALIPAGSALTYGDVAELLGAGGPRQVAAAMARSAGEELPWWRVMRADGTLPEDLAQRARACWEAEGTPLRAGEKVRFPQARWQIDDADFARIEALAERVRSNL